jgi:hypothetical protein
METPTHPDTAQAALPRPVLDFHVHPIEVYDQRPWSRDLYERLAPDITARIAEFEEPAVLRAHLLADGVDEAVVLGEIVPVASGMVTNERICAYAERGNEQEGCVWLHPFVSLNPAMHYDPAGELDSLQARWRVAGVKLTPPYQHFFPADPRMYPVYARCQDLGLPVMFHTGMSTFRGSRLKYADPLLIDDVAVDFPRLRIVLAHSGRGVWYDEAALMARLHEHVYLELAGLPPGRLRTYFPDLDRLVDKIIFGSDWPVLPDLGANVAALAELFGPRAGDVLYRTGRSLLAV